MLLLSLTQQYEWTTVRDVVRLLARAWQSISNEAILCEWRCTWADIKADVVASLYREHCGHRQAKDEILRWLHAPTLGHDCGPPPGIPINTNDDVIDNDNTIYHHNNSNKTNEIPVQNLHVLRKWQDKEQH